MSLSVNLNGWYLQISFSPLHPLMVICLARAIPIPASVAQFLDTNDMNLHSILGCHTINSDTHCYAYRATQWLDTELTRERFMEMLHRCMGEVDVSFHVTCKTQDGPTFRYARIRENPGTRLNTRFFRGKPLE